MSLLLLENAFTPFDIHKSRHSVATAATFQEARATFTGIIRKWGKGAVGFWAGATGKVGRLGGCCGDTQD